VVNNFDSWADCIAEASISHQGEECASINVNVVASISAPPFPAFADVRIIISGAATYLEEDFLVLGSGTYNFPVTFPATVPPELITVVVYCDIPGFAGPGGAFDLVVTITNIP
jgi:hypothetical protein